MFQISSIVFLLETLLIARVASQSSSSFPTSFSGVQATYWGSSSWSGGNCLFQDWATPNGPSGWPSIAVAGNLYTGAKYCGACVQLTSKTGIKAKGIISDQCPDCATNGLDLSPNIWNAVTANAAPGIATLDWEVIDCGFNTPISLITKDGASVYSFLMQAAGENSPVSSLEVQPPGSSTWINATRQDYNYFTLADQSSLNQTATANIRVTCRSGKSVTMSSVPLDTARKVTAASGNC